ncbi:hypothetical protein H4582DRAFT_2088597 [Lactarius indigo]|nr:hypothetical protein H4582DRAFT_2088597 [Lactarius indigo]
MALQLAGYYDSKRSNPLHTSPEEFFASLVEKQTHTLQRIANRTTRLDQKVHDEITHNEQEMGQIRDKVKESIFQSLNAEALNDLDTWQDIYREEFKEVMQKWIASNNFSSPDACFMKPDVKQKTRAKSVTPEQELNISQIETLVRTDCQVQIDVMRRDLLNDMKITMEKEIADLRSNEKKLQPSKLQSSNASKLSLLNKLMLTYTLKAQYTAEHEAYVRNKRDNIRKDLKAWKVHHANSRNLALLRAEAKKLGYDLVANSPDAFKPNSDPNLAEEDWLPSSRATSRASSRAHSVERQAPTTPPLVPLRTDPNVTPTPVRIKHVRTDDLQEPMSDVTIELPPLPDTPIVPNILFPSYTVTEPDPLPPAERISLATADHMVQDHPIDVLHERLEDNGGVKASMHAVTRDTDNFPPPQGDPTPSTPFEAPSLPAAPPAEESELMAMMKLVMGTITHLESQVSAQDQRISDLIIGKTPKAGPKTAKRSETVTAPPNANTASTSAGAMDEALSRQTRADDPAPAMPTASESNPPPVNRSTRPGPTALVPPSWLAIVTKKAVAQQSNNTTLSRQITSSTGRNSAGKSGSDATARRAKSNTTEVTVIRRQGLSDPQLETTIRNTPPSVIVNTA